MSSALEGILGGAIGKLAGGGGGGSTELALVAKAAPALLGMLSGGGAAKLLSQFTSSGHGEQAKSWVGTGENKPVTADHVTQALGTEQVQKFAQQAGIPADQAAAVLAQAIPAAIDHATPAGELPDSGTVDQALQGAGSAG